MGYHMLTLPLPRIAPQSSLLAPVDEWLSLFDGPILGNGALNRLANVGYQIVIEGTSYRERLSPHSAPLSNQGGD